LPVTNLFLLSVGKFVVLSCPDYTVRFFPQLLPAVLGMWLLASCSSHDLPDARSAFYQGNYERAIEEIGTEGIDGSDSVLVLMERGTIYQAGGEYEKSSMDFIQANDILDILETYSVSEGVGSWVVNDTVYSFEGAPFEQTILHSMTALNHLASGNWEDGGVEARRIIHSLRPDERGDEYPDDPFSRYLAAFILEMSGDQVNARVQYRLVDELLPNLHIDEQGGIGRDPENVPGTNADEQELVCFFLLGHSPSMRELRGDYYSSFSPPQIQIYAGDRYLGDASVLTSVHSLALTTWNLEAPARIAKMAARIAAKETIARSIEKEDAALGALTRIILIGMLERPDYRRWETLPRWLAVARIPYSDELSSFDIRLHGDGVAVETRISVQRPLVQRGKVIFSFVRDLPEFNSKTMHKEIDKVH
jgi:hypothetical protein